MGQRYISFLTNNDLRLVQGKAMTQNLTLTLSPQTEGKYYCHGESEAQGKVVSRPASLIIKGKPVKTAGKVENLINTV